MRYIKSLDEITIRDAAKAGSKALNCARLRQAGFPVPDGFVLTAGATEDPGFRAELENLLRKLPAEALLAVRSSATDEDSANHSFAGIHATKLNVARDGVAEAVRACRESVRSREAMSYRRVLGLPTDDLAAGVLVQHMVQPICSGVAFTINPVTGAADELVVNASWGLGEAVVGGYVDTDEFRIRKCDATIVFRKMGNKSHRVVAANGVSKLGDVEEELRNAPSLTDQQVRELAALILRIEQLFGVPQEHCRRAARRCAALNFPAAQSHDILERMGGEMARWPATANSEARSRRLARQDCAPKSRRMARGTAPL